MKLLLDSSAIIEWARGNARVREEVEGCEDINVSPMSVFEVFVGMPKRDREKLSGLLNGCPTLPFTLRDAARAVWIHEVLSKHGALVNAMDILIAAQALEHGLAVLTKDADFERISDRIGLTVIRI